MIGLPKFILKAIMGGKGHDSAATVDLFVGMADKARREGLLALEGDVDKIHDEFTRKGVQLMIDGTDPELLREIMEIELDSMKHRHEGNFAALEFLGRHLADDWRARRGHGAHGRHGPSRPARRNRPRHRHRVRRHVLRRLHGERPLAAPGA